MKHQLNNNFERLTNEELCGLRTEFSKYSLLKKETWSTMTIIILCLVPFILLFPAFPGRSQEPMILNKSSEDLLDFYFYGLVIMPISVFMVYLFLNLRMLIDINAECKWVFKHRITARIRVWNYYLFLINGWYPKLLNTQKWLYHSSLRGDYLVIKRTLSLRLIGMEIEKLNGIRIK